MRKIGDIGGSSGTGWRVPARAASCALAAMLSLGSCGQRSDDTVVIASVIGAPPRFVDPDRFPLLPANFELLRATEQGLVAFDAAGQIEPALAESWTFTKDGLSVIFRIRRMKWPDGGYVTGADVAASLNRAIAPGSRNPLKPLLSSIESVVGMTERVVEVRLRVPRPNLLQLLAQPELAIRRGGVGSGPWIASRASRGAIILTLRKDEDIIEGEEVAAPPVTRVTLRGERASVAIARFQAGDSRFVTGGTLGDWPILQVAQVRASAVRIDPGEGLFGLATYPSRDFMKHEDLRESLSMAIDRDALIAAFAVPRWQPLERLLPSQLDSAEAPTSPGWSGTSLGDRRSEARKRVAAWTATRGALAPLRVALPDKPGMTVLFARIASDWRTIGVSAVRVELNAPDADLRLIDAIAPNASANWYLTMTSCDAGLPCNENSDLALKASRAAPDLAHRAAEIAKADAAAANSAAFIPLARPVRWSLVDPRLTGFRENAFAVHPFRELRVPRN